MTEKTSVSVIGVGAFGAFIAPYLAPHMDLCLFDPHQEHEALSALAQQCGARIGDLHDAVSCDIVILAVPVRTIESVAQQIAPMLKPGQLVMDVASVKCLPAQILQDALPD